MLSQMTARAHLPVLFQRVDARVRELQAVRPGWPCGSGCDGCCKRLARVPELTLAEWELLRAALLALPEAQRRACLLRAMELEVQVRRSGDVGPLVCPLLDAARGTCLVYDARPLGCRTYGFYASHHHDAWCELVTEHLGAGRDGLVLGNLDAIERDLSQHCSERRDLLTWLRGFAQA
jgi:Fe-S-cluster containining protein